jgi:hypothetical protein
MCDGKGYLTAKGFRRKRRVPSEYFTTFFECMLCNGKTIIDAGVARDYILECLERTRPPVKDIRAIARIIDE